MWRCKTTGRYVQNNDAAKSAALLDKEKKRKGGKEAKNPRE